MVQIHPPQQLLQLFDLYSIIESLLLLRVQPPRSLLNLQLGQVSDVVILFQVPDVDWHVGYIYIFLKLLEKLKLIWWLCSLLPWPFPLGLEELFFVELEAVLFHIVFDLVDDFLPSYENGGQLLDLVLIMLIFYDDVIDVRHPHVVIVIFVEIDVHAKYRHVVNCVQVGCHFVCDSEAVLFRIRPSHPSLNLSLYLTVFEVFQLLIGLLDLFEYLIIVRLIKLIVIVCEISRVDQVVEVIDSIVAKANVKVAIGTALYLDARLDRVETPPERIIRSPVHDVDELKFVERARQRICTRGLPIWAVSDLIPHDYLVSPSRRVLFFFLSRLTFACILRDSLRLSLIELPLPLGGRVDRLGVHPDRGGASAASSSTTGTVPSKASGSGRLPGAKASSSLHDADWGVPGRLLVPAIADQETETGPNSVMVCSLGRSDHAEAMGLRISLNNRPHKARICPWSRNKEESRIWKEDFAAMKMLLHICWWQ